MIIHEDENKALLNLSADAFLTAKEMLIANHWYLLTNLTIFLLILMDNSFLILYIFVNMISDDASL